MAQDSIVDRLVPDPSAVPRLTAITGWLARSPRENCWRLYLTPAFTEYVEFAADDLSHHHAFDDMSSVWRRTTVWLRADASVVRTAATAGRAQGEFLQGGVARAFLSAGTSLAGIGWGWGGAGAVNTWVCPHPTAGTCTLVVCTKVEECKISREANPCV